MKIGDRVRTQHGIGVIVKKDMPESEIWRWVVRITEPFEKYKDKISLYKNQTLCYFSKDIKYEN